VATNSTLWASAQAWSEIGPNSSKHTTTPSAGQVRHSAMMRVVLASNCGSVLHFHERVRWNVTFRSRRMRRSVSIETRPTTRRRSK
jgi:hypothetical protein